MAETLKTYSPAEVEVNWAGYVPIKNFADGTAIEMQRNTDNTRQLVGMQGDVGLTYNPDKTGTVSFTLMQTGESNYALSAIQNAQDTSGKIIRADLTISDPSGSMLAVAKRCHLVTPPVVTLGDDQNSKVWTFYAEEITFLDAPAGATLGAEAAARISAAVDGVKSSSDALENLIG